MDLFYNDTAGHLDEWDTTSDNAGLNKRNEFGKLVKLCSYKEERILKF